MISEEEKFWNWFKRHNEKYKYLDNLEVSEKEHLLEVLLKHLHEYCKNLYFQIGGFPNAVKKELLISAEGNIEYFYKVEKLLKDAPNLDSWEIIAFKQPMGSSFVTEYEGLYLDPQNMKFIPLENDNNPSMLGIQVLVENYESQYNKKFIQGVYQVLDTLLGEKANALEINYLEVNLLNKERSEDNLTDLVDLKEYIEWRKKRRL